ncbi:MAG: hypothetical protein GY869_07175 [Planctomycetes bacterium]|nr:hypothetical protein [Planctomycetota bacterium]
MLACRCHLIVTMRSKVEYVVEEDNRGRKVPRKVGMAPVQRDGLEYEFDVVGDMDLENTLVVTKSRCSALAGAVVNKPGRQFAENFSNWLSDGLEVQDPNLASNPTDTFVGLLAPVVVAGWGSCFCRRTRSLSYAGIVTI